MSQQGGASAQCLHFARTPPATNPCGWSDMQGNGLSEAECTLHRATRCDQRQLQSADATRTITDTVETVTRGHGTMLPVMRRADEAQHERTVHAVAPA